MRVKNIFIFLIIFAVLLWLFLSKSGSTDSNSELINSEAKNTQGQQEPLSSAIELIQIVDVVNNAGQKKLGDKDKLDAQQQFNRATEYVLKRKWQEAENLYLDLNENLPLAIEPYINLAVVYAETDRLDQARKVLMRGVKANPNYEVLFNNLQLIHGSLAAKAYRKALIIEDEIDVAHQSEAINLDLPLINSMDLRLVDLNQQQALLKQVSDMEKSLRNEKLEQQNSQARIAQLEQELVTAGTQIASLDESKLRVAALEAQIKQQADAFASSEQALVVMNESMSVELAATQNTLLETTVVAANVNEDIVALAVIGEIGKTDNSEEVVPDIVQNEQADAGSAFKLVENWAAYWSKQDVAGYVSQYANNYSPRRSELNHKQWLEQRRVRLTNKKFIQVDVSDFEYDQSDDDQFSVTFLQRYRSDTIDDTIRKRLVFTKHGLSLLDAKIVDEIIITN